MNLKKLVKTSKNDDGEAFVNLVTQYEDILYNIATRFLSSEHDIANCMQETIIKLVDENNNIYNVDSASREENGDLNNFKINFPITTYNNSKKLKLLIEGVGETYLVPID